PTAIYTLSLHDALPIWRRFIILDAHKEVGASWRSRWDSLRLFTPNKYNSLPGLPFPGKGNLVPTKDEVADYFQDYAKRFALPVRSEEHTSELQSRFDLV